MGRTSPLVGLAALLACEPAARPRPEPPAPLAVPPTGVYDVTARVLSDTCTPAYVAPPPWRSFVDARASRDTARLEFSVSATPPETRTDRPVRAGLSIVPPQIDRRNLFMPDLPTPIGEQTLEISGYSRHDFTLALTVTDTTGDAPGCATRVEHVFRVLEPICEARCTRGVEPSTVAAQPGEPPRMRVDCSCP